MLVAEQLLRLRIKNHWRQRKWIKAWGQEYKEGRISYKTWYLQMQEWELIPSTKTPEQEMEEIEENPPSNSITDLIPEA